VSQATLRARLEARVGQRVIDLEIDTAGEILVIVGPNGAGKTLLLGLILGIVPALRGRIVIGDEVLLDTAASVNVPVERRRLGYVPQEYGLFPHLTVQQNIAFALSCGSPRVATAERARRTASVLAEFQLEDHAARFPRMLSGGEKQRVALARAVCVAPRALLLDEPMAALDVHSRKRVVTLLSEYLRKLALPALVVTHDPWEAQLLGHRVAVIEEGRITQCGTWAELTTRPASRFVEDFVAGRGGDG
jgi:molybdate transport system ATP-binding protein